MTAKSLPSKAQTKPMNWFDQQFSQIGWPMLIMLTILFTILMMIFSGIGVLATRNPIAHHRAKIIFIISTTYVACCGVLVFVLVRHPELLK